MTDATNVDDILVVGQRKVDGGTYPTRGGGGGGGSTGGPQQNEVSPDDPNPPTQSPPDPCSNPDTRREWDADAAVAAKNREFQQDAGDPRLDGRERSAVIAYDPVTGRVYSGNMRVGPDGGGTVGFDLTGINPGHIIGLMHSHPGSGPYPSGPDQTILFPEFAEIIRDAGGNPSLLRLYIVGTRTDPGGQARLQIRVYNANNLNGDEHNPGPEVNPDAQACS